MKRRLIAVVAGSVAAAATMASPPLHLSEPIELSVAPVGGYDGESAAKGKLVRLEHPDGQGGFQAVLVCVYAEAQGPDVWDYTGEAHPARDLFATRSTDGGLTWSPPINLSNTASLTSISANHDGDPTTPEIPYHGDSEKPNVVANGKIVLVSWVDRYVPDAEQRSVVYPEFGQVEVPYAAVYATRSLDAGLSWSDPQRLTSGYRDAKQDSAKASGAGVLITWQEDPQGLQPGQAEGPGDGGSGAKVSKGTDIWFTALKMADVAADLPFPAGARVTDNFTMMGQGDNEGYEYGSTGASRANGCLVGSMALVAYEETKGLAGLDEGKYIRYHAFSAFNDSMPDTTRGAGWIISDPNENARRVRFVPQPGPLSNASDLRVVFLWKQGLYDQGGPSDILSRLGIRDPNDPDSTGYRPVDLRPPVDPRPVTREAALNNEPALNLSSSLGLGAGTDDDPYEDARAHRGIVRGNFVAMGWSWTPDWAVARFTDLENYNFYVRRSLDGGFTWTEPVNMSNIDDSKINVKEPRIIAPPFSPDPDQPNDADVYFVGWGTEVNQYEHVSQGSIDLDIYVTRTDDRGETYGPVQVLAGGDEAQFEAQLRTNAAGDDLYAVWQERTPKDVVDTIFVAGDVACVPDFNEDGTLDVLDFVAFQIAFTSGDLRADVNGDGVLDVLDFVGFQALFVAGC